ncbi:uncharacterized protein LOC127875412 [Dreissena polymorpha]|uniref:uncharacterized protein LOC127875412 n=1 Tax=Dreissena polymorpha TaxID=45954 RepID=UPI0022646405|nr:uncharacterized protein LOC127875412 [Dreissena polymorpha]XP_052276433.1 uncharacterized protein LOC127875412 [Dreissena polymorpha]XP_052276434.1 uncharacterized protein LOC127875412 [Dreissena polymorpha]
MRYKMPDQFGNILQTDSKYLGNFIRGLPIMKPFKIHYHDPWKQNEEDGLKVGVFMIVPRENIIDEREVMDLTISIEGTCKISDEAQNSIIKNELETPNIESKNQKDVAEVKIEPTSDCEDDDTHNSVYHDNTLKMHSGVNKERCYNTDLSISTDLTKTSTTSEIKIEIENIESEENCYVLNGNHRFNPVSYDDMFNNFMQMNGTDCFNKNTKRKTEADLKMFNSYLQNVGEKRTMEMIPPDQLNDHICGFLLSATKKDGDEYEPTSIRSFVSSIERHLRTKGYKCSVINGVEFAKTRQVLKTKQNHVKSLGKGNRLKHAHQPDNAMIQTFYECGTLGDRNPVSLIHSLWLMCTVNFGMKSAQEMYEIKWGDIQVKEGAFGTYLQYENDRKRKTKRKIGGDTRLPETRSRAYSTSDPQKDPIHLYTTYRTKRPECTLYPESPFFLAVAYKEPLPLQNWYKNQAMGRKRIQGIMSEMKHAANLITDKRTKPPSARKLAGQKLFDDMDPSHNIVVPIPDHTHVSYVNNSSIVNTEKSKSGATCSVSNNTECNDKKASELDQSNAILLVPEYSAAPISSPSDQVLWDAKSRSLYRVVLVSTNALAYPAGVQCGESSTHNRNKSTNSHINYKPEDYCPPNSPLKKIRKLSCSSDSEYT